jgi:hypothetical protein
VHESRDKGIAVSKAQETLAGLLTRTIWRVHNAHADLHQNTMLRERF